MVAKGTRREYGTGSITWLGSRRARLRVRIPGESGQRSKVVRVAHRDHGGRSEAAEELATFIRELAAERARGDREVHTVDEMVEEYIAHCKRIGRRQGTLDSYRRNRDRLTPTIATVAVDTVTPKMLDDFYGELSTDYSPNTIRLVHATLTAAFGQAMTWGWLDANPALAATPPLRHRPKRKPLPLADVRRLIDHAVLAKADGGFEDPILAMAVIVASLTGARRGELAGLRWDDLDETARTITIERQWIPGAGGQYLSETKSFDRPVHLGVVGLALFERYRDIVRDMFRREPDGWLLSYDGGITPVRAKGLGERITTLGTRAGVRVTPHYFRRVQATQLVAANVDVDTAARRMGHTTAVMLQDYVLGADDRSVAAADVIEARLIEQGLPLAELLPAPSKALTP